MEKRTTESSVETVDIYCSEKHFWRIKKKYIYKIPRNEIQVTKRESYWQVC